MNEDTIEKLKALQVSPEILTAIKILIAAKDTLEDVKSFIRFTYPLNDGRVFEMTFLEIKSEVTYNKDVFKSTSAEVTTEKQP